MIKIKLTWKVIKRTFFEDKTVRLKRSHAILELPVTSKLPASVLQLKLFCSATGK